MAGLSRWVSVLSCFSRFSLLFSLLLYSSYFGLWRLVGLGRWSPSLVFLCCILVVVFLTVVLLAFCASEVGWVGKVVSFSFSFCVVFLAVVFLIVVLLALDMEVGWAGKVVSFCPFSPCSVSCCIFSILDIGGWLGREGGLLLFSSCCFAFVFALALVFALVLAPSFAVLFAVGFAIVFLFLLECCPCCISIVVFLPLLTSEAGWVGKVVFFYCFSPVVFLLLFY